MADEIKDDVPAKDAPAAKEAPVAAAKEAPAADAKKAPAKEAPAAEAKKAPAADAKAAPAAEAKKAPAKKAPAAEAKEAPAADAKKAPAKKAPAADAKAAPAADAKAAPAAADGKAAPAADAKAAPAAAAAPAAEEGEAKPVRRRIKGSKNVPVGVVHILASFNNTTVSVTDPRGNVISWSNGGRCGFKGSRKSTAYAGTIVCQEACKVALGHGLHEVEILVQGPGSGRESAIRAVQSAGIAISAIRDITPVPHNGCRAKKRRRV